MISFIETLHRSPRRAAEPQRYDRVHFGDSCEIIQSVDGASFKRCAASLGEHHNVVPRGTMQTAPSDAVRGHHRDPLLIDLALQGGGAHGAFTWGVLDRLLEEPW